MAAQVDDFYRRVLLQRRGRAFEREDRLAIERAFGQQIAGMQHCTFRERTVRPRRLADEVPKKIPCVAVDLLVSLGQGLKLQKIGMGDKRQTIPGANAVDDVRVEKKDAFIDKYVFH
jgi:hypothetical protein